MTTWGDDIKTIEYIAGDLEFEIEFIQPWHLRLSHPNGRRLDYFPKSGRATWVSSGKWFTITDIEKFIYQEWQQSSIKEPQK